MSDGLIGAALFLYICIAGLTFLCRYGNGQEETAPVAAGVLWPVYLPYRLALMIWNGEV